METEGIRAHRGVLAGSWLSRRPSGHQAPREDRAGDGFGVAQPADVTCLPGSVGSSHRREVFMKVKPPKGVLGTVPGEQPVCRERLVSFHTEAKAPPSLPLPALDGHRLAELLHLAEKRCFAEGEPGECPLPCGLCRLLEDWGVPRGQSRCQYSFF